MKFIMRIKILMLDVKVNICIWLNRVYNFLICYVNKKVRMGEVIDRVEKI